MLAIPEYSQRVVAQVGINRTKIQFPKLQVDGFQLTYDTLVTRFVLLPWRKRYLRCFDASANKSLLAVPCSISGTASRPGVLGCVSVIALCRALEGPWYWSVVTFSNAGAMTPCAAFGVTTGSLDTVCDPPKDARKEAFSASNCSIRELESLNTFSLGHNLETSSRITFC